jgi:hypothetical protein
MDANLMNCPSCGHSVSSTAGACAYCGAIIAGGGAKEQTAEEIAGQEAISSETEAPAQPAETPAPAGMAEATGETMAASEKPSESIPVQQAPVEPAAAEPGGPAGESEILAEAETAKPDAPTTGYSEDSIDDVEIAPIDAVVSEVASIPEAETAAELAAQYDEPLVPEADAPPPAQSRAAGSGAPAEDGPEDALLSPAPEVLELTADDTDELETLGTEIVKMVENIAHEEPEQQSKSLDSPPFRDQVGDAAPEAPADDGHSTEDPAKGAEKIVGLTSEALGETILLEPADEVQTPVKGASGKGGEAKKTTGANSKETADAGPGSAAIKPKLEQDVLKIEKAAGEMAAAIKKQKAKLAEADESKDRKPSPAKIQGLKQRQAELAKQQAKKKQKLLLAQAAALKRKKAAEAKALALNKQNEDKALSKAPNQEPAAVAGSGQKAAPPAARGLEAKSGMQALLKKYEGQAIGINYDNSAEIREALLEKTNDEYFSVFVKDKQLHYSYPLKTILTVIEGKDGVETGSSKPYQKFNAVVKVYPLVLF